MESRPPSDTGKTHAGHPPATSPDAAKAACSSAAVARVEHLIATELPPELRHTGQALLRAVIGRVAVAEHFDAFCGLAFSKPEWAAMASPVIAELFEHDEDQLAELARIPDLVIEMGSGQATVTCMVASRWAARGETHRLTRLAESIVASHAAKNACAVEVMLALAATLAVTRLSKAEQLFNAAMPLAGEEHQEALQDARRWVAAGRVVCSASPEERDFWDVRLRKPKTAWSWQSKEELQALDTLSERLSPGMDGAELFRAVVPPSWWAMAMKSAQLQEKLQHAAKRAAVPSLPVALAPRSLPETPKVHERPAEFLAPAPRAGSHARFILGWVCGAMATAITVVLLPADTVNRIMLAVKPGDPSASPAPFAAKGPPGEQVAMPRTPADREAWRKENASKMAADMKAYAAEHAMAKTGTWRENEMVLSGHGPQLPFDSPQYMKFLVWLHLDPPANAEVRRRVSELLLDRVKADAITLWEELSYPGSSNDAEIKEVARGAASNPGFQWQPHDKQRLLAIAGAAPAGDQAPETASTAASDMQ